MSVDVIAIPRITKTTRNAGTITKYRNDRNLNKKIPFGGGGRVGWEELECIWHVCFAMYNKTDIVFSFHNKL